MRNLGWIPGLIFVAAGLLAACSTSAPRSEKKESPPAQSTASPLSAHRSSPRPPSRSDRPVPPYHESAEAAKPFPRLVPAAYFRNYPLVARAYEIASEIPAVIAQQPCYCYCDKFGHRSLLDCYASDHGAG
ncbi:MAG: hypothetical protein ACE5JQ_15810 [Candidatus Methylomirabilales bacterium]